MRYSLMDRFDYNCHYYLDIYYSNNFSHSGFTMSDTVSPNRTVKVCKGVGGSRVKLEEVESVRPFYF